jgi:uncharacterized protein
MAYKINLKTANLTMKAELNDTTISGKIIEKLPIKAKVNTWGDEIYFPVPVKSQNENGVTVVQSGDLCFWPPSGCFCIFFGKTPISKGDEIQPASEVTIIGKLQGKPEEWKVVNDGEEIVIEKV